MPPYFMTNDDHAEIRRAFSPRLARDRRRDSRARFVYPIRELNVNVFRVERKRRGITCPV